MPLKELAGKRWAGLLSLLLHDWPNCSTSGTFGRSEMMWKLLKLVGSENLRTQCSVLVAFYILLSSIKWLIRATVE